MAGRPRKPTKLLEVSGAFQKDPQRKRSGEAKPLKGKLRGQEISLQDWQCFCIANIFGWKWTKNDLRRFKFVYKQVPRKNGKSLLAICIALQMFACDSEFGTEVYLGATSQDQAKDLLFNPAKQVVNLCPEFRDAFGIEVNASTLVIPEDFSVLKAVIKKPGDGQSPHCAIVDEYHEHDTDDQYSTFETGLGAREQPLLVVTTTAGSNLNGPCREMHMHCEKILNQTYEDDTTFILIYQMDEGDSWDDERVLSKVNPNIGVSVSEDYLIDQLNKARVIIVLFIFLIISYIYPPGDRVGIQFSVIFERVLDLVAVILGYLLGFGNGAKQR